MQDLVQVKLPGCLQVGEGPRMKRVGEGEASARQLVTVTLASGAKLNLFLKMRVADSQAEALDKMIRIFARWAYSGNYSKWLDIGMIWLMGGRMVTT